MDSGDVGLIILGACGVVSFLASLVAELNYKHAKKILNKVKHAEIEKISNARELAKIKPYEGYVTGKIKKLGTNDVVYSEIRSTRMSFPTLSTNESQWDTTVSGSRFALIDGNDEIFASPMKNTITFGLQHEYKSYSPIVLIAQGLFMIFGNFFPPTITIGESEYVAYNGQQITLFGKISYDTAKKVLEMNKIKFMFRGAKRDVELHLGGLAESEWWNAAIVEMLTVGIFGGALYLYIARLRKWKKRRKNEGRVRILRQKLSELGIAENDQENFKCCICLENVKNVIYRNCSHLATCEECDATLNSNRCPICRANIVSRTFIALE